MAGPAELNPANAITTATSPTIRLGQGHALGSGFCQFTDRVLRVDSSCCIRTVEITRGH
jgi:hypothetical protein